MTLGKIILVHLLVWFIACSIAFWLVPPDYINFAIVGAFVVLFIDYLALRAVWLKYMLFAIMGVVFAIILNGFIR